VLELLDLRDRRERLEPRHLEIDPHVSAIVREIVRHVRRRERRAVRAHAAFQWLGPARARPARHRRGVAGPRRLDPGRASPCGADRSRRGPAPPQDPSRVRGRARGRPVRGARPAESRPSTGIRNAGATFAGSFTRVPITDCGVASNVVLPTGATEVAAIARSEGLGGHARTVEVRTDERRAVS
jgi:hypothetical protein